MRLKAIHALQQLLCAGPCRLALIVADRLRATLAGVALFLGHLAHGFHRVAVFFRVFTVALRDEPSNLRRISPLLGTLCPVLSLWPLWCGMHGDPSARLSPIHFMSAVAHSHWIVSLPYTFTRHFEINT